MSEEKISIEDEMREALAAAEAAVEQTVENAPEYPVEEEVVEEQPETVVTEEQPAAEVVENAPAVEAPIALSGAIKAKWKDLPADVQAEWKKREDDIHRMMTAKDGELNLGRSIKEIAAPYEAIIRAEGGTVEGAFKDLLNTSYILRAGTPQQKAEAIMQAVQQFNVDLSPYFNQGQNPQAGQFQQIQQEIAHLRQQADPNRIKSQLQEQMERDRINGEIQAFAANPKNVHFEAVKSIMGSLISSGRAKDLQEAYDTAIWSDPSIRQELLKTQAAQDAEKKKAEMAAKKKAAASVAGSPSMASPNANAPQKSLEDEMRQLWNASSGKI